MVYVGKLNGDLVYFTGIWYILWIFGIFPSFGMLYQEKSGRHGADRRQWADKRRTLFSK
jgi:hypothetical protein